MDVRKVIIPVIHAIFFIFCVDVGGDVITVVVVSNIKAWMVVSVTKIEAVGVAERQLVHPVDEFLWERNSPECQTLYLGHSKILN